MVQVEDFSFFISSNRYPQSHFSVRRHFPLHQDRSCTFCLRFTHPELGCSFRGATKLLATYLGLTSSLKRSCCCDSPLRRPPRLPFSSLHRICTETLAPVLRPWPYFFQERSVCQRQEPPNWAHPGLSNRQGRPRSRVQQILL